MSRARSGAMSRACMAALLGAALARPAHAQAVPLRPLDPPQFSIQPRGLVATFAGEPVDVVAGWRPVPGAARYRVTLTGGDGGVRETSDLRVTWRDLPPGTYALTVAGIDRTGAVGTPSEPLPIKVFDVRAIPPGAERSQPPTRGAYALGTRFSAPGMHCALGEVAIDDLLAGPENEVTTPTPGRTTLRCAGAPGYLEAPLVIAPVRVAATSARVARGTTTTIPVTLASVAAIGERVEAAAIGDITLGTPERTPYGLRVPVTISATARSGALSITAAGLELGRVPLELVDAPAHAAPRAPLHWQAFDLGGQFGAFVPPSGSRDGTTIGRPRDRGDVVTGGPLVGLRLGLFPIPRVGLEGEASLIAGGYADQSGISRILSLRGQLAVRAVERGRVGLRLFAGAGALTSLKTRGTSQQATESALHGGAALTIETSPNLWLRLQVADVVTTARDDGSAHCLELQLSVVTRVGRRDSW